jgi:hypothetical protein
VPITTRCMAPAGRPGDRFPFAESIIDDARLQPYIHDCAVTVYEAHHVYRYRVYFKRHCRLGINHSIPGNTSFRGDALVMRVAARNELAVVNMRERDTIVSDFMISR